MAAKEVLFRKGFHAATIAASLNRPVWPTVRSIGTSIRRISCSALVGQLAYRRLNREQYRINGRAAPSTSPLASVVGPKLAKTCMGA